MKKVEMLRKLVTIALVAVVGVITVTLSGCDSGAQASMGAAVNDNAVGTAVNGGTSLEEREGLIVNITPADFKVIDVSLSEWTRDSLISTMKETFYNKTGEVQYMPQPEGDSECDYYRLYDASLENVLRLGTVPKDETSPIGTQVSENGLIFQKVYSPEDKCEWSITVDFGESTIVVNESDPARQLIGKSLKQAVEAICPGLYEKVRAGGIIWLEDGCAVVTISPNEAVIDFSTGMLRLYTWGENTVQQVYITYK